MKKYYEAYDLRYQQVHEMGLEWFDNQPTPVVAQVMQAYGVTPEKEILEIGCGEGRDAAVLLDGGYRLLATDVAPRAVQHCREKFPCWADKFQQLDCLKDDLPRKFDFIYAVAVLHMLVLDEDRQGLLRFIGRHLTANGVGLVVVMGDGEMQRATDITAAFELQERRHGQSGQVMQLASTSCCMVTREAFREEILRAGLEILTLGDTTWSDAPAAMYAVVRQGEQYATDVRYAAGCFRQAQLPYAGA